MNHKENRKARFRTVIALVLDGKEYTFDGIVNGSITTENAEIADLDTILYSCLIPIQKLSPRWVTIQNQISHRAKAVMKLTSFLSDYNC